MAAQQTTITREELESRRDAAARLVLRDYRFSFSSGSSRERISCRVWNPTSRNQATRKGYRIEETPEGIACSCEAFQRSGDDHCKHVGGLQLAMSRLGVEEFIRQSNKRAAESYGPIWTETATAPDPFGIVRPELTQIDYPRMARERMAAMDERRRDEALECGARYESGCW